MITKFIQFSDAVTNGFTAVELQCLDVVGFFLLFYCGKKLDTASRSS